MIGDSKVIQYLNLGLGNELIAINQYFLHARMFDNWGFKQLGKHEYDASIDEMKDADMFVNRILFLEGVPNMQDLGQLNIGGDVKQALEFDLKLELKARADLQEMIAYFESVADFVSRKLACEILEGEEKHVDWLETQLQLIDDVGLQNYLQSQM